VRLHGGKGLEFPNNFLAATIGIEDLREKSPEGIFFTEHSAATQGPRFGGAQIVRGNEFAQTRAQLTERFLFQLGEDVRQFLLGGPGSSAKSLEMKPWQ